MSFNEVQDAYRKLEEMDCSFRYFGENGGTHCEIIDNQTKKGFVIFPPIGDNSCTSRPQALLKAVEIAANSERPLTTAQLAVVKHVEEKVSAYKSENEELRQKLAELTERLNNKSSGKTPPLKV